MIERFEDEFPETRVPKPTTNGNISGIASTISSLDATSFSSQATAAADIASPGPEDDNYVPIIRPESLSRRPSTPSLAFRQAQEEGRMHRFGQRIQRDILRPETEDYANGVSGREVEAEYLQDLRMRLEGFEGSEIQETVERLGPNAMFEAVGATPDDFAARQRKDPEGFERLMKARADAMKIYQGQKHPGHMDNGHVMA